MNISTKFDIGQTVYPIRNFPKEVFKPCKICEGSGEILVQGEKFNCPNCYGNGGRMEYEPTKWQILQETWVGNIKVELYKNGYGEDKIRYMIQSYGIGSGQLWNEEDLCPSFKEAQAECEKRNNEIPSD